MSHASMSERLGSNLSIYGHHVPNMIIISVRLHHCQGARITQKQYEEHSGKMVSPGIKATEQLDETYTKRNSQAPTSELTLTASKREAEGFSATMCSS